MEYESSNPRNMIFEYIVPSSTWAHTADSHCLLIHLPGFKQEQVRIRADNGNHVIVSGERRANDNKIIDFEQSFEVPEDCDIEETSGIFEDETFCITMPKKVTPQMELPQLQNSNAVQGQDQIQNSVPDGAQKVDTDDKDDYNQNNKGTTDEEEEEEVVEEFHRTRTVDGRSKSNLLEKLSRKVKKNRGLVFTAFVAFSLGVVVSHRFQSTAHDEKTQ